MMKTTKTRAEVAAELHMEFQRARRWILLAEITCAMLAAVGVAIAAASCHL